MNDFERAISILTKGDRHRVWSLIVTVFGDLAGSHGDEIGVQTLGKLTEPLGVKAEALRVALHRLRKEGWLESRRDGRSSTYFLTAMGLHQTEIATPRIYCQTDPEALQWKVYLTSGSSESASNFLSSLENSGNAVRLSNNAFLGEALEADMTANVLTTLVDSTIVPDWVRTSVISEGTCNSYEALSQSFRQVGQLASIPHDALQRATLRTLIVHSWRRIRLRHLDAPEAFYPTKCFAKECKSQYLELLEKLPRPSLEEISKA